MNRRWKVLAVACATALAMPASAAVAHDPEELGGTPLTHPFGHEVLVLRELPDRAEPVQRGQHARHELRHRLLGRPRLRRRLRRVPHLRHLAADADARVDVRCYGPQGDPSVFDRDGDGNADTLVLSVDSPLAGPQCGAGPASKSATTGKYPDGAWEGIRDLRHLQPAARRSRSRRSTRTAARTPTRCCPRRGAAKSMYVSNSSYPLGEGPTCGPLGAQQGRKVNHGVVQVVEIPFSDPAKARGAHRAAGRLPGRRGRHLQAGQRARHRRAAGRLPRLPRPELVPGRSGSSARRAASRRRCGRSTAAPACRTRRTRSGSYDQPNVDFWHSATFSWDGKVANFIDESFGDGCPTVTMKTGGAARPAEGMGDGQHVLLRDRQRRPAVGVPQPAADERQHEPDDRQVLLVAPRHPGAGA